MIYSNIKLVPKKEDVEESPMPGGFQESKEKNSENAIVND